MSKEKLSRILGLRLLAIREGVECGAIRELVLDVEDKAVKYLVLDTGKGCFGFRVLPNEKIAGMGKDFAITSSSEFVSDIWTTQTALDLNYTDSDLIGARVVSSSGDVVGKIVDFEFELIQGDITAYVMEDGGVLPRESIVTLSRGIVFIDKEKVEDAIIREPVEGEDASSFELFGSQGGFDLEPEIAEPEAEIAEPEPEIVEAVEIEEAEEPVLLYTEPESAEPEESFVEAVKEEPPQEEAAAEETPDEAPVEAEITEAVQGDAPPAEESKAEEAVPEPAPVAEPAPVVEAPPAEPVSVSREPTTGRTTASDRLAALRNRAAAAAQQAAAPAAAQEPTTADNADMKNYFEKRRTEFLIGKIVKQQITAADGTILAEAGQQVTAEMIEKIKAADKIIELTMGVN